ncbi:hypothetical protein DM02DRAFT_148110 [Periconia macrospinosa]|uniref:Secreted protein n=1 Tax=Periconia macrospinosa TaxID=97972 RepID=A0A2V1DBR5_9PLEO|nr:hypothetical protein DM02DRAFT_148110 [Periconia macrospinosa]
MRELSLSSILSRVLLLPPEAVARVSSVLSYSRVGRIGVVGDTVGRFGGIGETVSRFSVIGDTVYERRLLRCATFSLSLAKRYAQRRFGVIGETVHNSSQHHEFH